MRDPGNEVANGQVVVVGDAKTTCKFKFKKFNFKKLQVSTAVTVVGQAGTCNLTNSQSLRLALKKNDNSIRIMKEKFSYGNSWSFKYSLFILTRLSVFRSSFSTKKYAKCEHVKRDVL